MVVSFALVEELLSVNFARRTVFSFAVSVYGLACRYVVRVGCDPMEDRSPLLSDLLAASRFASQSLRTVPA